MTEDIRNMKSVAGIQEFNVQYERPDCIVLDSAYCSMGRMIAFKACSIGGYAYYDAVILLELVPEYGLTKDDVDVYEKKLRQGRFNREELLADPEYVRLSEAFSKAADIALKKGRCLIHDRLCKEEVIAKGYSCVNAMTYALDMKAKIVKARVSPLYQNAESDEAVIKGIHEEDMIRANWHRGHSNTEWGDMSAYDLAINTDAFGLDYAAHLLAQLMKPE